MAVLLNTLLCNEIKQRVEMRPYILVTLFLIILSVQTHAKELAGGVSHSPSKMQADFKELLKFAKIPYTLKNKHKIEYIYWPQEFDSKVQKIKNIFFEGRSFDKASVCKVLGNMKQYKFFILQSANKGNSMAQGGIGANYLVGEMPFEKNLKKAKYWLETAVKNNNHRVAGMLANIYVKENYPSKQIHDTFLIGANAGDQISMCKIAGFYDEGLYLFNKNPALAKEWRTKSKRSGIDCSFFDKYKK